MQGIENKGWGVKEILKPSQAEHFRLKSCYSLVYVQDCPRNLPLKLGQNRVSNSWDIPDMDKCRKD